MLNSCAIIVKVEMAFNTTVLCGAAYFAALRVYAIFDYSKTLFWIALAIGQINPVFCLYIFLHSAPDYFRLPIPSGGCAITTSVNSTRVMIGGRATALILDATVFLATWHKTRSMNGSLITVVLNRDSCLYFALLFITNFVSLAMLWHTWKYVEPVSTWIAIITATLTSHFILDLRKVSQRSDAAVLAEAEHMQASESFQLQATETIVFATESGQSVSDMQRSVV
ncbi:uncharacterized protein LAESUDRAFT_689532 [Laetiporus sulphureus 93-53]|uniref:Uncharacterized protein n=1 Tax=Laetiporus sulphureus 93-53 TaxID=1314785 RepID=A0A165I8Z0_9APHY|nr:uncharacterized protein LAESUDRAFT_689532 [Laetiporus sulphureus 93-53]KZT12749.1 hypothetical protein LAESUDRAFT_689532 [Laetiporus sulphureus 93-53]